MLMMRWQNFVAILAIFFAAGAIWPWSPLNRIVCVAIAFALILVLLVTRMQQHASSFTSKRASTQDMQSRIDRIREERDRRYGRR